MDLINSIVAANLRALREERRLSLDGLAGVTGVSKSMLGMIERGEANPTIGTLWKIANGMKVPFTRFMARPDDAVERRRVGDIRPLLPGDGSGYRNYPLFPMDDSRPFEVYWIEVDPGGRLRAEPHPAGTQEIVAVFSGALGLRIGEREERLAAGEAIRFRADVGHEYSNPGKRVCRMSMVIAYPRAGE